MQPFGGFEQNAARDVVDVDVPLPRNRSAMAALVQPEPAPTSEHRMSRSEAHPVDHAVADVALVAVERAEEQGQVLVVHGRDAIVGHARERVFLGQL